MNFQILSIHGLLLLQPRVFGDLRGFVFESFSVQRYHDAGCPSNFLQENISSSIKGVLRGLHFQKKFPQGKLVSILVGRVYDVVVDLRPDSSTFGKHVGVWLDDVSRQQLYVPPGCAHGFYVVSEQVLMHYKCTDYYHPEDESGFMWNDPALNIDWPLTGAPILSKKDQEYSPFERDMFLEKGL